MISMCVLRADVRSKPCNQLELRGQKRVKGVSMLEQQLNTGGPQLLHISVAMLLIGEVIKKGVLFFQGKSIETKVSDSRVQEDWRREMGGLRMALTWDQTNT